MKKLTYLLLATTFLLSCAAKAEAAPFEGPFFGLQLGDTFTTEKVSDNLFFQPDAAANYDLNPRGVTGGVLGGYRWRFNKYVVGIEASGSLSNARSGTLEDVNTDTSDTQFSRDGTLTIGPKFGYLLMDHMMGFVGVDYALGQFKNREIVNGAPPASCASGSCPNGNYLLSGIGFGGGLELAMTDKLNLRLDYEHTTWQSKTFTDASGDTAKISPDDNAARVALIYNFK